MERLYNIYRYEKGDAHMHMVFRDHSLSDLIGFVYSGVPAKTAAEDMLRRCPGQKIKIGISLDGIGEDLGAQLT